MSDKKIAFLGTGLMGFPMSVNLSKSNFTIHAWNRTIEKALPLKDYGVSVFDTAGEAVSNADIIFTMLSDGHAVDSLLFEDNIIDLIRPQSSLIDCSSISFDIAKKHAKIMNEKNIYYIDAPVSGGVIGAQEASLAIMAGGDIEHINRLAPIFSLLGRVTHVGPNGSGQLCKLANQQIVAITLGAIAEAMTLVQSGGASAKAFRDAIRGGFAESRILELHGERMINQDFKPLGLSKLQLKDLNGVNEVCEDLKLNLPLTQTIRLMFEQFVTQGGGDLDHSAIIKHLYDLNPNQINQK